MCTSQSLVMSSNRTRVTVACRKSRQSVAWSAGLHFYMDIEVTTCISVFNWETALSTELGNCMSLHTMVAARD
jgi:hypothetical protein